MTGSRLSGKELSNVQWVEVQATWLGVNIPEASGGEFLAPIYWLGNIGFCNWQMRFSPLTSSGTSGSFTLVVPDLFGFPNQRCGVFHQSDIISPVLLTANVAPVNFSSTRVMTQSVQIVMRSQISNDLLNY
jgi:hypothetical protein